MSVNGSKNQIPFVEEVNGKLVLNDPVAVGVISAVGKSNCKITLEAQTERVSHFKNRVAERGLSPDQVVIVLLNVDDPNGGQLAEALMPGTDWQPTRDLGQVPYARGLAMREGIQEALAFFDESAAKKLSETKDLAVVVVDYGVAEIFVA